MLSITKLFPFEMAHAIHGYSGACKHIHGHSYLLEVTVAAKGGSEDYIPAPGFIYDFKDLKKIVVKQFIEQYDHKLVLSEEFLINNPGIVGQENLLIWTMEPTAENILLYIKNILVKELPAEVQLVRMKLHETRDSFAEWGSVSSQ